MTGRVRPGASRRSYHHGDLRAALIDAVVELIAEKGIRGFSITEASRRLGVTSGAPYSHFASRDDLLAAVAIRAAGELAATLTARTPADLDPADRLGTAARSYVTFASANRALFEVLFGSGLDKQRHPELEAASQPVTDIFLAPALALCPDEASARDLAFTIAIAAHGHATLLLDGAFGRDKPAVERAADHAAATARAIIGGWPRLYQ
ncbi:TetR/AcrR family transcriptional regulator [Phytohabitans suffuscus]|uniref:TetR family transcriptional regulator n=1 Tax=Phytohabitans suffuscus TaxID=624315 RepID=A0A6F8YRG4_9ACTN|nr:TetR/AcrR family transcriptional regulator [Phytohabitans suffuscus]BCB88692.1 TetR family transcriptional regulator [Phytohabitans suffuscus]